MKDGFVSCQHKDVHTMVYYAHTIDWHRAMLFTCRGLLKGWASGSATYTDAFYLPSHKVVQSYVEDGEDFRLTDAFSVTEGSPWSSGMTLLEQRFQHKWLLIWRMRYEGMYLPEDSDFVKECLRIGHALALKPEYKNFFFGCRGPHRNNLPGSPLFYINNPEPGSRFELFSGREEVRLGREQGTLRGWHGYAARTLLL